MNWAVFLHFNILMILEPINIVLTFNMTKQPQSTPHLHHQADTFVLIPVIRLSVFQCVMIPRTETRTTLLLLFSFFIYTYLQNNNQQQRFGISCSLSSATQQNVRPFQHPSNL